MTPETYTQLKNAIVERGYERDIEWAKTVTAPRSAEDFALEIIFVICNSGMKAQIARPIYERIVDALLSGRPAKDAFGHPGKSGAIQSIWTNRLQLFWLYEFASDKLAFIETLPWIGPITKFHVAKNFGVDCCKPDRHLVRIAKQFNTTPDALCAQLAAATGDRIGLVDLVIWRAANLSLI